MKNITENGVTKELYYIGAPDGLAAGYQKDAIQGGKMYYAHTDHQGSIVSLTDSIGVKVFQASYDAWGKQTVSLNTIGFYRGYTGHEHLPEFGLINMNGRMYDPVLGRFLSPDNYVQEGDLSQNFNRYSYCLNNPLKYTDPSGELFGIDDAILIYVAMSTIQQGIMSGSNAEMNGNSFSSGFWKGAAVGFLSSSITSGVGSLTSNMGVINQSLVMGGTAFATTGLGSMALNGNWDMNSSLMAGGMAFGMGMLQLIGNGNLYSDVSTEPSGYDPANPGGDLNRVKSRAALKHIKEGDFGLGELTTNGGHGETVNSQTGHFKNNVTGKPSEGYTYRKAWSWSNGIRMHISPYASYMDDANLDGVLTHEGTHMWHYFIGLDKKMSRDEFENRTEYSTYSQMKNEILNLPANIQSLPGNVNRLNEINGMLRLYNTPDSRFFTPAFLLGY